MPWLLIPAAALGVWLLAQALGPLPATPVTVYPPPPATDSSPSPSVATWPPELIAAANAIATSFAETPSPPPTPYRSPTPLPPKIFCGINEQTGQSCEWPLPTIVATTQPVCQTPIPASTCTWMGSRGGATPIAIIMAVSGT